MGLNGGIPFANIILLSCSLPFPSYCTSLPTSLSPPLPSSSLASSPLFCSLILSLLLFSTPLFSSLSFIAYSILSNLYFFLLPSPLVSSPLLSYLIFSSAVLSPPPICSSLPCPTNSSPLFITTLTTSCRKKLDNPQLLVPGSR
jgi:hypothetical protein